MSRGRVIGGLLLLLCGCWSSAADAATVFLARRGWHIDIGFATAELLPPLSRVAEEFPGARYIFFGFGDRRYLESGGARVGAMLRALWPGAGVLLTTGLSTTPEMAFGASHVLRFEIPIVKLAQTQEFIWNSLTPDEAAAIGSGRAGAPGPYQGALYLDARPIYWAGHTCNTWAAEALSRSQPHIHSTAVLFAGQLWREAARQVTP